MQSNNDRSFASQLTFPQQFNSADKGGYMGMPQFNPQGNFTNMMQEDTFSSWNVPSKQALNTNAMPVRDMSGAGGRNLISSESTQAAKPAPRPRPPKNRPSFPPGQSNPQLGANFSGSPAQGGQGYSGIDYSEQYQSGRLSSSGAPQRTSAPYPEQERHLEMDVEVSEYTIVNQVSLFVYTAAHLLIQIE
jgi:hypothetical protein